jgi:hypothetical protein
MAEAVTVTDPVRDACRRVGERLGDTAFREFGADAGEAQFFGLEWLAHGPSDAVLDALGASDQQRLLAKILIGHSLRKRYEELVRAGPAVQEMKAGAQ